MRASHSFPMTGEVRAALLRAEESAQLPRLDELGDVDVVALEVVDLADSSLAPLTARALVAALDRSKDVWASALSGFIDRLDRQRSYLALTDTLDVLLAAPSAVAVLAVRPLHDVLIRDPDDLTDEWPLVAAARLEGALRIALTGEVTPYLVLDRLARIRPGLPDEYVEGIPRLVGMALDRWEMDTELTAPLVAALEQLRGNEAAAPEAAYELACRLMRKALRESERDAAAAAFLIASEALFVAADLDEVRDDASVYGHACAAVAAFGARDLDRLRAAATALGPLVARRIAWHRGMNEPAWRRPQLNSEIQWLGLVIDLDAAAERLEEQSWLDSMAAVGQLARVYASERTTAPSPGLSAVVRPAIENVLAESATLFDQLERTIAADRDHDPILPEGAHLLLGALQERRRQHPSPQSVARDHDASFAEIRARIDRLAPGLWLLGDAIATDLAAQATDDRLTEIGTVLATINRSGVADHPALGPLRARIIQELSMNPALEGKARAVVVALLDATLTFVLDRYDRSGPILPGRPDIYRALGPKDQPPLEKDFQAEFYIWLSTSQHFAGRSAIEQTNIARGRIDVLVRMDDIVLVTEIKRELDDASRASLESNYTPQAAAYSGANVPISQLLVLDLTKHPEGVPPLQDLIWTVEYRAQSDASPQHVVAAIVVGNRPTPSALQ